jgi:hypothetical protein
MLDSLLSSDGFIPRGRCGEWTDSWMTVYIGANLIIAAAYFAIPIVLYRLWCLHRIHVQNAWVFLPFGAFILFCGGGHIWDGVVVFVWPNYRFFALWHSATALVSIMTAGILPMLFLRHREAH